jgi:hypothetical protein
MTSHQKRKARNVTMENKAVLYKIFKFQLKIQISLRNRKNLKTLSFNCDFSDDCRLVYVYIIIIIIIIISLLFIYVTGVESSPLTLRPLIAVLCQFWMIDANGCGAISGMNVWQGKQKYSEATCPSAALSTTGPTALKWGSNRVRPCGKPATNRPSYGTAQP